MRLVSIILIGLFITTCNDSDNKCIRGKFLNYYCEGVAIKVLSDSKIGVNWNHPLWSSYMHENVVIASIDSALEVNIENFKDFITTDSLVYFEYRDGGYPQKQYNLCYPAPFITITGISTDPFCNE